MSIDNMNTLRLIPSKDYNLNRLTAGMLQLAAGTHLVLNETALHQGQLSQAGEWALCADWSTEGIILWSHCTY